MPDTPDSGFSLNHHPWCILIQNLLIHNLTNLLKNLETLKAAVINICIRHYGGILSNDAVH